MTNRVLKCWKFSVIFYTILYSVVRGFQRREFFRPLPGNEDKALSAKISGVALAMFTSFILLRRYSLSYFFGDIRTPIFFLYVPSILILLTAFAGWKALQKKHVFFLKCFAVFLATVILIEISAGIWCFISKESSTQNVNKLFVEKFGQAYNDPSLRHYWDDIQEKMKCCGVHGPNDYRENKHVPFSCCASPLDNKQPSCPSIYQEGCLTIFKDTASKDFFIVSLTVIGIAILQMPGIFAVWFLANRILREAI